MAKIGKEQVEYLVFEGGGGQGIAYLGAIKALEELGVLPIVPAALASKNPGGRTSSVKGVSGGSVGSMTAILLALGLNSTQIARLLSKRETFIGFYDGPDNNRLRHIENNRFKEDDVVYFLKNGKTSRVSAGQKARRKKAVKDFPLNFEFLGNLVAASFPVAGTAAVLLDKPQSLAVPAAALGLESLIVGLVHFGLRSVLESKAKKDEVVRPLIQALIHTESTFEQYLYNFFFDRGLFPGYKIREFVKERVAQFLKDAGVGTDPDELTIKGFQELTGVELVASGTNLTKGKPFSFTSKDTPDFPVIDAVMISSCYPFAFKPILVTNCKPVEDGYWIDGGTLNNLPLHAFDEQVDGPLNQRVLGFRLQASSPKKDEIDPSDEGLVDLLGVSLRQILDTLLYPSEEGQIRLQSERDHVIPLNTSGLSTLEFSPPIKRSRRRIYEAYNSVYIYFEDRAPILFPPGLDTEDARVPAPPELEKLLEIFPSK